MVRLACLVLFSLISLSVARQFGIPSYWGESQSSYSSIPAGAYAILNPDNGALNIDSAMQTSYKKLILYLQGRGVRLLGYIPTGYNQQGSCAQRYNDIGKQISAWNALSSIDGYFFDEAGYESSTWCGQSNGGSDCAKTTTKWSHIRSLAGSKVKVWNSGEPGPNNCMVTQASVSGEHVVISEDQYSGYSSSDVKSAAAAAKGSGVKSWVLVYKATEANMDLLMSSVPSDFVFVTDKSAWNSAPSYWTAEKTKL